MQQPQQFQHFGSMLSQPPPQCGPIGCSGLIQYQQQQQACLNNVFAISCLGPNQRQQQQQACLNNVFAISCSGPNQHQQQQQACQDDIFATESLSKQRDFEQPQLTNEIKIQAMKEMQEKGRQIQESLKMNNCQDDVFAPESLKSLRNQIIMEEKQERNRQNQESQLEKIFESKSVRGINQKFPLSKITYIQIMQFAQANGSFVFPPFVLNQLGLDQIEQNLSETIWPTIYALLLLEIKCSQNKATWQLVYSKGIQFLLYNGIDYLSKRNEYMLQYQVVLEKVE